MSEILEGDSSVIPHVTVYWKDWCSWEGM